MKRAARLNEFGQSAWLDLIGRKLIHSGELARMAEEDGIRGVTANPAIFEKAIVESDEYDDQLKKLIEQGKTPLEIYEAIAIDDVRSACDVLRPVFDRLQGRDGFVSLEVSPYIARDTKATVQEAKRFWGAVDRPNLFIKIPANPEGIPAIRQATAAGVSVNITLIFSVRVYEQVIDAYLSGLEERVAKGLPVSQIHSVASFFVSRVDTSVDKLLEEKGARDLLGKIAVANAKEAYQVFLKSIASSRWKSLESRGATRQRPLWASTGTKNKAYSDVLYVEPLIGRDTVNTMPLATLHAFNDHGKAERETVTEGIDEARAQLARLGRLGIDLEKVCADLTDQGLDLFSKALDGLLHAISARSAAQTFARKAQLRESLGRRREDAASGLEAAREKKIGARLWARDTSLWGTKNVAKTRLGWLESTKFGNEHAAEISAFASEAGRKFRHCVLLGMGGSSLAPEVIARILGKREGGLDLRVLDSTAPDSVRASVNGFDLRKTLFLVSSKSGTTTEVDSFYRHFRAKVDGANFVAITDPGTPLQKRAQEERFWKTFVNPADIGGRYSALSYFGLVPAALLGLDPKALIEQAERVALASHARVPLQENLALRLGAIAAALAIKGADKITFLFSKNLAPLGAWLEQLIAESTGKQGKGIVPVDGEPPANADAYGNDRLFVSLSLQDETHDMSHLAEAGLPLLQWKLATPAEIAGEFLRWELATAAMGAVLEIDPFDEPNVAESKDKTKSLLSARTLPSEEPALRSQGLALFASSGHAQVLRKAAGTLGSATAASPAGWIAAHLALADPGNYVALQLYLPQDAQVARTFQELQGVVRDATKLACTVGFGPRFLHSTGQLHKGGPNTGLFLQITSDGGEDLAIPGVPYSFGTLFAAQARGDLEVLQAHGRRALRVHVEDGDPGKAAAAVRDAMKLLSPR
jgi:transaldolase/glucose-6-phosphate isomerase